MEEADLCECSLMGREVAVTQRIRQILTNLLLADESTASYMVRLASREEFGLHASEKMSIKRSVKDNEYWQAAEDFLSNWVCHKAMEATFGVLLAVLQELGWTTLKVTILGYNWAEVKGVVVFKQRRQKDEGQLATVKIHEPGSRSHGPSPLGNNVRFNPQDFEGSEN